MKETYKGERIKLLSALLFIIAVIVIVKLIKPEGDSLSLSIKHTELSTLYHMQISKFTNEYKSGFHLLLNLDFTYFTKL